MSLAYASELLPKARAAGYAVGAFNMYNLETLQAIISAAEELRAPVLVQVNAGTAEFMGQQTVANLVRQLAAAATVPVALHLDHGKSFDEVMTALRLGYTSVMFDGSSLSLEDNADATREVVKVAHSMGAPVEGELGRIAGSKAGEDLAESDLTTPEGAKAFVEATGVDSLAVGVGTQHGLYRQPPALRFDLLEGIARQVALPLVMHGGTGVSGEDIQRAVSLGISKFNVATGLKVGFMQTLEQQFQAKPGEQDLRKLMSLARARVQAMVAEYIQLLGCAGKA
jgi:ketose-bisphosphate aldolase